MFAIFVSILAIAVFYLLKKWVDGNLPINSIFSYFKIRNIKYWKPAFILGSSWRLFLRKNNSQEFVTLLYKSFPGEKIIGFFDGLFPIYVLKDIEVIKKITIKDFDNFEDHRAIINSETDRLFGNTLLIIKGKKWREMRSTLSPAFTGTKMRQMFDFVVECSNNMAEFYVTESSNGKPLKLEMKSTFSRITNDVIASCAFGLKTNSFENPNNEFYAIGSEMFKSFSSVKGIFRIFLLRTVPKLMCALGIEFLDSYIREFFHKVILETMDEREKHQIYRPDMVNILMQIRKGSFEKSAINEIGDSKQETAGMAVVEDYDVGKKIAKKLDWNDDELVSQAFIFFAAGFDTTATLLQFAAYELAVNFECQEKLIAEVDRVSLELNGAPLTYDSLPKLKYMDMVVSEALRMYPALPFVDRMCVRDYHYQDDQYDFEIKKDEAAIWVPVVAIHYDPEFYPNPDKFDPERFSDENKANMNMGAYMPFGVGPRNCIGSRFALMEIKSVFYHLLKNFTIHPCKDTQIPMELKKIPFGIAPKYPVELEFKKR